MVTPSTTVKIEAPLHARLLRAAKQTNVSKADLVRLCVDVGLPRVLSSFAAMKGEEDGKGMGLLMKPEQLAEARELYKSAVTDVVAGVDHLDGKDFVAAVERLMPNLPQRERIGRFLAVYAQLF